MKTMNAISMMAFLVALACNVPFIHDSRAAETATPPVAVSGSTPHPVATHTMSAGTSSAGTHAAKAQAAVHAATAHTASGAGHTGSHSIEALGGTRGYTHIAPLGEKHEPHGSLKLKIPEGPKYTQDEGFRQRYEAMMNSNMDEPSNETTQSAGSNGFRGPYIGPGGAAGTAGSWSGGNAAENDNIAGLSGSNYR